MICYLDSSVVLSVLLNQQCAFNDWHKISYGFSSELMLVECYRVLDRARLQGILNDIQYAEVRRNLKQFSRGLTLYELNSQILARASEPFNTIIGTLDALHLSTALLYNATLNEEIYFLTLDSQLRTAATAVGLNVIP